MDGRLANLQIPNHFVIKATPVGALDYALNAKYFFEGAFGGAFIVVRLCFAWLNYIIIFPERQGEAEKTTHGRALACGGDTFYHSHLLTP